MSTETEIQTEVEALKARFSDTKSLYREVCALLFFRYGITPTASKLYQYVRRGSMGAPAEALAKFWDDLRSKARVEIDHPDLPDDIKKTAAEAIAAIWRQATGAAREELRVLRDEAAAELTTVQSEFQAVRELHATLQHDIELVRQQLGSANAATHAAHVELESERRAHAASAARIQELQRQIVDLQTAQEGARVAFTGELDKARAAVAEAVERLAANERRALREVDDERQAKKKAEQQLEQLRTTVAQTEARTREQALADAEAVGRLRAQFAGLELTNRNLVETSAAVDAQMRTLRNELDEARQDRVRYRTEAETAMAMVERLTPAGTVASPAPRGGKSKKS